MFTLSFLNSWTEPSSKKEMYILDPQLVARWWDTVSREGSSPLDHLSAKVEDFRNTSTKRKSNPHDKIRTSKLSIVMLCGHNHWTVVAFANLLLLFERLERATHMLKRSHKQHLKQCRATMFFVDSMSANNPPHAPLSENIVHYLTASYPGQNVVSFHLLSSIVTAHHLRCSIQQDLECGFFTTYHIEIISKQISTFLNGSEIDVQKHFNLWYTKFSFSHYADCIRHHMEVLMHTFEENGQARVPCNMFTASAQQPLKQPTGTTHPSVPHTKTPITPEAFNAQHTVHQRGEANRPKTTSKRDGFHDGKRQLQRNPTQLTQHVPKSNNNNKKLRTILQDPVVLNVVTDAVKGSDFAGVETALTTILLPRIQRALHKPNDSNSFPATNAVKSHQTQQLIPQQQARSPVPYCKRKPQQHTSPSYIYNLRTRNGC
ncbi:hypothetical protein BWQ96_05983 [Gracilariopsis chorda]|uniref:Uncharacterized protein n=1 Tax=Gracilariopsis chorda TaxID=448386 RepID=A0A2V3IQD0_9FLOR|nr:hypothetical protein BWQ96_05983 [Gracilariopsis chorda]|eukprot:PXF44279.1 hypothetical protein BWQ96_05983 [Gracilariopsis chorda]